MKALSIDVMERAARHKAAGYIETCIAYGVREGDRLKFTEEDWKRIQERFPTSGGGIRIGDAVAFIAQPVAAAIDAVFGTDLKNCRGCEKRQEKLNSIGQANP